MKHLLKHLTVVGLIVGAFWALTAWPLINDVETGKTPQYPDLHVTDFGAGVERVTQAVKTVVGRLPGWTLVGSGSGPAGGEIQAVRTTRLLRFKDDVTIRIRREGGRTQVSVRSRSRIGKIDFGQNARNIQELLAELNQEVF